MQLPHPKREEQSALALDFPLTYLGDGPCILIQRELDTNYFIGLAIFVLCEGQTLCFAAVIFQNLTGRCDLNGFVDFLLRQALCQLRIGVCVKNIFSEHVRSAQPKAVSHWVSKGHGSP